MTEGASSRHSAGGLERTRTVRVQTVLSFAYKGLAIVLGLAIVPVGLRYLGPERFGIWITLLSVLSWLSLLDVGLGNGMQNRVAEAIAVGDHARARRYISTTYFAIACLMLTAAAILAIAAQFVDMRRVFNTSLERDALAQTVTVLAVLLCANFVLGLVNPLFNAAQQASLAVLNQAVSQALALGAALAVTLLPGASLTLFVAGYGAALILANAGFSLYFFSRNRALRPSWRLVDLRRGTDVALLGIKFYVIQICAVVIFSTGALVVTQLFGPEQVTPYGIALRLFAVITVGHATLVTPLWAATTDAFTLGDVQWIRTTARKLRAVMWLVTIVALALVVLGERIVALWVGPDVKVGTELLLAMACYAVVVAWNNNYAYLINGIGHVTSQLYSAVIGAIVTIPLAVFFARGLGLGLPGVVLGTVAALLVFSVVGPIQLRQSLAALERPSRVGT